MKFKDRFTEDQRKTKYYKFLREYYYVGGYGLLIIGIVGMIIMDYIIIRGQLWRSPEGYSLGIALFIIPLIPLIGGISMIRYGNKKINDIDWERVYKIEKDAGKKNPWKRRR